MTGVSLACISASPALAPMDRPITVDAYGRAFVPHPFDDRAAMMRLPVGAGMAISWAPMENNSALLALSAGSADAHPDEAIAVTLTRAQIQQLILDLVSIDRQLGDS